MSCLGLCNICSNCTCLKEFLVPIPQRTSVSRKWGKCIMALREKVAFNFFLGLIPDNITYSPCCSSYFIRRQFAERKMGKKRGTCPWKQFDGTRECHRTSGQLGDISASGQLVLALTHGVTPANKEYPSSPTRRTIPRLANSCLLSFSNSVVLKL